MMRFMMMCAALLAAAEVSVQAGPPRRNRQNPRMLATPSYAPVPMQQERTDRPAEVITPAAKSIPSTEATTTSAKGVDDALEEVNAERAKRGLKPFLPDSLLNQAARECAKQRAARFIHGHLPESDFSYLPSGASATSAGCGALEPSWGWGTCCAYDNYTYAGAAWVMGADGRRYMHLFVR